MIYLIFDDVRGPFCYQIMTFHVSRTGNLMYPYSTYTSRNVRPCVEYSANVSFCYKNNIDSDNNF